MASSSSASTPPVELWTCRLLVPGTTARFAKRAEEEGWDGLAFGDSQNLAADAFVELGLAAGVTTRMGLGTAVTNPVTRHPAVTASAIASVHAESGGRAVLGIGRGDSALAHLGLSPAPVPVFAHFVERLQGYLRGDHVPFEIGADGRGEVASAEGLGLAGAPTGSKLQWLPNRLPKVPVDVYATGPKVIALAARQAERVTFAVGSGIERVRWAVGVAREARRAAGLDPDHFPMGLFVPILVHPDMAKARALAAGGVASFARFSAMHGTVVGPVDEGQRQVLEAIHDAYDMNHHFGHGSSQAAAATDDVIDAFGIVGPAGYCIERIQALAELGISRITVQASVAGGDKDEMAAARRRLTEEILPALK